MPAAEFWIEHLQLQAHPEGGYFRESYRSSETISQKSLPQRFSGDRTFSTAIYFLLPGTQLSALHRIASDEIWHFYAGSALTILVITPLGDFYEIKLGSNVLQGEQLQAVVPAGCWFGAMVNNPESYALTGCTVAPGFDFADFEMADRETLLMQYPSLTDVIKRLT